MRRRSFRAGLAGLLAIASGAVVTSAAPLGADGSVFVPITSCRLTDTRPAPDTIGPRATPLHTGDTYVVDVWGTNGNCTIPTSATAVSMNVTVLGPTATSYLTVWPADVTPRPLVSSLNWTARQGPTPNAVTTRLSADGKLALYNLTGDVDVIIDVVGYHQPATAAAGPAGPTGPTGAAGSTGAPGPTGPAGADAPRPSNIISVATSGGDFTTLSDALAAIGTTLPAASANHPYRIDIGPGTFVETSAVSLRAHVDVHGAGIDRTVITCDCDATANPANDATVTVVGQVDPVLIADLTITNAGASAGRRTGLATGSNLVTLDHVRVHVVGAPSHVTTGLRASDGTVELVHSEVETANGLDTVVDIDAASLHVSDSVLRSGSSTSTALRATASIALIRDSSLAAVALTDGASSTVVLSDSTSAGTRTGVTLVCSNVVDLSGATYTC